MFGRSIGQAVHAVQNVSHLAHNPRVQKQSAQYQDYFKSDFGRSQVGKLWDSSSSAQRNRLLQSAVYNKYDPASDALLRHVWPELPVRGAYSHDKASKAAFEYLPEGFKSKAASIGDIPGQAAEGIGKLRNATEHFFDSRGYSGGDYQTLQTAGVPGVSQLQDVGHGLNKIIRHGAGDAATLIPATGLGIYQLGRDTVTEGPLGMLKKDIYKPYKEVFTHPIRSFQHNPVTTPLMFTGAYGALGRLGRLGMSATKAVPGIPAAVSAAAETARPSIYDPMRDIMISRKYSPNVITRGMQRVVESKLEKQVSSPLTRRELGVKTRGKLADQPVRSTQVNSPRQLSKPVDPSAPKVSPYSFNGIKDRVAKGIDAGWEARFQSEARRSGNERAEMSLIGKRGGRQVGLESGPGGVSQFREVGPLVKFADGTKERLPFGTTLDRGQLIDPAGKPMNGLPEVTGFRETGVKVGIDRTKAKLESFGARKTLKLEHDLVPLVNKGILSREALKSGPDALRSALEHERNQIESGAKGLSTFENSNFKLNSLREHSDEMQANRENLDLIDRTLSRLDEHSIQNAPMTKIDNARVRTGDSFARMASNESVPASVRQAADYLSRQFTEADYITAQATLKRGGMAYAHTLGKAAEELITDERIPKSIRGALAVASLPWLGPIDNVAQVLLLTYIAARYNRVLREAWSNAAKDTRGNYRTPGILTDYTLEAARKQAEASGRFQRAMTDAGGMTADAAERRPLLEAAQVRGIAERDAGGVPTIEALQHRAHAAGVRKAERVVNEARRTLVKAKNGKTSQERAIRDLRNQIESLRRERLVPPSHVKDLEKELSDARRAYERKSERVVGLERSLKSLEVQAARLRGEAVAREGAGARKSVKRLEKMLEGQKFEPGSILDNVQKVLANLSKASTKGVHLDRLDALSEQAAGLVAGRKVAPVFESKPQSVYDIGASAKSVRRNARKRGYLRPTNDYRGQEHLAPTAETGTLSYDLTQAFGKDIYSSGGYKKLRYPTVAKDPSYQPAYAEAEAVIKRIQGNPEAKVTIYRAVPASLKDAQILPGDWVTPSRKAADLHGENIIATKRFRNSPKTEKGEPYKIISKEVPAKDLHLFKPGDKLEDIQLGWGYDPVSPRLKSVLGAESGLDATLRATGKRSGNPNDFEVVLKRNAADESVALNKAYSNMESALGKPAVDFKKVQVGGAKSPLEARALTVLAEMNRSSRTARLGDLEARIVGLRSEIKQARKDGRVEAQAVVDQAQERLTAAKNETKSGVDSELEFLRSVLADVKVAHKVEKRQMRDVAKTDLERSKNALAQVRKYRDESRQFANNKTYPRWVAKGEAGGHAPTITNAEIAGQLRKQGVDPADISYVSNRPGKGGNGDYYQRDTRDRAGYQAQAYGGRSTAQRIAFSDAEALRDQNVRSNVIRETIQAYDSFMRHAALGPETLKRYKTADYEYKASDGLMTLDEAKHIQQIAADKFGVHLEVVRAMRGRDLEDFANSLEKQLGGPEIVGHFRTAKDFTAEGELGKLMGGTSELGQMKSAVNSLSDRFDLGSSSEKTFKNLDEGTRNVRLVPSEELAVYLKHSEIGAPGLPIVGAAFRRAVLPLSTKWLAGNFAEAELRKTIAGVVPLYDVVKGRVDRRFMDSMRAYDPNLAAEFEAQAGGGLLFAAQTRAVTRTESGLKAQKGEAFGGNATKVVYNTTRTIVNGLTDQIFALNSKYEHSAKRQVRGKAFQRELRDFTGSWVKSVKAEQETIDAILKYWENNPKVAQAKAAQFGRYVDQTLGKYSKFNPELRNFIQGYAPFIAWTLNSIKFMFHLMPVKHPVLTAVVASTHQALDPDIKDWIAGKGPAGAPHGPLRYALDTGADHLPDWVKSITGIHDGALIDFNRLSPVGAFTDSPAKTLMNNLTPQIASAQAIVRGRNPITGREMQDQNGKPIRDPFTLAWLAAYSLAEVVVPGLSLGRRLGEGGKSGADNSTVFHTHTRHNAYDKGLGVKAFFPLPVTYLSGSKKGSAGSIADEFKKYQESASQGSSIADEFKNYQQSLGN